jgi:hypothetical protein
MMIATLLLSLASVAEPATKVSPAPANGEITKEQAEARLATCGSRKFESVAEFSVAGKVKRSRLALCAQDSETNAEWIAKLEKARVSVQAQSSIPESARFKLLSDLGAEIDRLKNPPSIIAVNGDVDISAKPKAKAEAAIPKNDFAISTLPSMPTPKKGANTKFDPTKPVRPLTKKPQLTINCLNPGGAPARCTRMALDTALEVSADEDLASTVTLLFRRLDADRSGEVRLAQLKRGDSIKLKVPAEICKGVVLAEFDVQVTGPGSDGLRYSDVVGPFEKRC